MFAKHFERCGQQWLLNRRLQAVRFVDEHDVRRTGVNEHADQFLRLNVAADDVQSGAKFGGYRLCQTSFPNAGWPENNCRRIGFPPA